MQTKTLETHGAASHLVSAISGWFGWCLNGFSVLRNHTHSNIEFIFKVTHQTNPTMFSYASLKFYSNLISESHTLHIDNSGHFQAGVGLPDLTLNWLPRTELLEGSMHIPNNLTSSSHIMDLLISVFFSSVLLVSNLYINIFKVRNCVFMKKSNLFKVFDHD